MSGFFDDPAVWLPWVFAALMGLSILIYVVMDGFDLGVGLLFPFTEEQERDRMIASIGPFWDANETWLVLAIGLLLVAFPVAHGQILSTLYLPVAVMLIGLIFRGVAFEFRAKAPRTQKAGWDTAFFVGSLMTSLSQGAMLGMYVMGLTPTWSHLAFAGLTAVFLTVAYSFVGATWLILKTEGYLQIKAVSWARGGIAGMLLGIGAVSVGSPFVSERIFEKWFGFPQIIYLAPFPIAFVGVTWLIWHLLGKMPRENDRGAWVPFGLTVFLFILAFAGLAYSFYPYVVPEQLTIYEAASAPESLMIILIGTCFVLPVILGYTVLSYVIFRGKATALSYE